MGDSVNGVIVDLIHVLWSQRSTDPPTDLPLVYTTTRGDGDNNGL